MLDLLLFRVLSLLRTEFSFSPCLPQSSLCVSACSVLTNRRFFLEGSQHGGVERCFFGGGGGRMPRAGPSARESRARAAGRGGYGRDKRGPPVWRRAISLRNSSAGLVRGVSARVLRAPGRCPASTCLVCASTLFRRLRAASDSAIIHPSAGEPGLAGARIRLFSRGEKGKTT